MNHEGGDVMANPPYPFRDRRLDSWWWDKGEAYPVTVDGFLSDGAVLSDDAQPRYGRIRWAEGSPWQKRLTDEMRLAVDGMADPDARIDAVAAKQTGPVVLPCRTHDGDLPGHVLSAEAFKHLRLPQTWEPKRK